MADLFRALAPEPVVATVAPGAVWLRHWLTPGEQEALVTRCRRAMDGPAGGYSPQVRGGGRMRVRMTCLGRHWNAQTYDYEARRSDYDGQLAEPLPDEWIALASTLAEHAGFRFQPDICIVNWYDGDGRMGLHQDKSESPMSLEAGLPVVSVSLGDTARFLLGGLRRRDPVETLALASGDVFVLGGPSRLRYHGVSRIFPGSGPAALGLAGRFNLTFRQFG